MHYCWHAGRYIGLVPSRNLDQFKTSALIFLVRPYSKPDTSQDAMLAAREKLEQLLIAPQTGTSWRDALNYFHSGEHLEGVVNISPAWFQLCHDVRALIFRLYSSVPYSKSGGVATIPAAFCKHQIVCRIGLARCHLRIQWNFERNPGGNTPKALWCRPEDYQAPKKYPWDFPGRPWPMGVRFQRPCPYI